MRFACAATLLVVACPVGAQDTPAVGIGFSVSEQGTWLCRHEDPVEALACARELCAEQSPGLDCAPTAWCRPADWSGVMNIFSPEARRTRVLCGTPSEKTLGDALAAFCAADPTATTCDLVLVIDPDGNERQVTGVIFAGGAAPGPAPEPPGEPGNAQ